MSNRGHPCPTVAIIGSGPAGAVAAWALGKQYDVTVFEKVSLQAARIRLTLSWPPPGTWFIYVHS